MLGGVSRHLSKLYSSAIKLFWKRLRAEKLFIKHLRELSMRGYSVPYWWLLSWYSYFFASFKMVSPTNSKTKREALINNKESIKGSSYSAGCPETWILAKTLIHNLMEISISVKAMMRMKINLWWNIVKDSIKDNIMKVETSLMMIQMILGMWS